MTDAVETFQDHIRSIAGDQQKLAAFVTQVRTPDDLVAYAAEAGCPLAKHEADDLFEKGQAAFNEMQSQLSDDDLEKVVGGISFAAIGLGVGAALGIAAITVFTAGIGTAFMATAVSAGYTTWGAIALGTAVNGGAMVFAGGTVGATTGFVVDRVVEAVKG